MQPDEWLDAWEHRVIHAREEDRHLPVAARAFLLSHGLPRVVIFQWRNSFEIAFSPLAKELVFYNTLVRWGAFRNEALDRSWGDQVVIGEEDFCNGSASYCVHKEHGTVSRIDCGLSNPQCFVNSSVEQFGRSLLVGKRWSAALRARGLVPSRGDFQVLARELASVDGEAFATADHFWRNLIEVILDEAEIELEITDDPARSRPRF
jgi:hypothetical protein